MDCGELQDGLSGVYAEVAKLRRWIDAKIGENGGGSFCGEPTNNTTNTNTSYTTTTTVSTPTGHHIHDQKWMIMNWPGNGTGTALDWNFCTRSAPCTNGQGDCDSHSECADHHLCGENNCRDFWSQAIASADCCIRGMS